MTDAQTAVADSYHSQMITLWQQAAPRAMRWPRALFTKLAQQYGHDVPVQAIERYIEMRDNNQVSKRLGELSGTETERYLKGICDYLRSQAGASPTGNPVVPPLDANCTCQKGWITGTSRRSMVADSKVQYMPCLQCELGLYNYRACIGLYRETPFACRWPTHPMGAEEAEPDADSAPPERAKEHLRDIRLAMKEGRKGEAQAVGELFDMEAAK